jgi:hypothetical protein
LHGNLKAAQEGRSVVVEQLLVLVQKRFALGRVGNEERNLRTEFDRRREAAAAGANDAQLIDPVEAGGKAGWILPETARLWRHLSDFSSKTTKK